MRSIYRTKKKYRKKRRTRARAEDLTRIRFFSRPPPFVCPTRTVFVRRFSFLLLIGLARRAVSFFIYSLGVSSVVDLLSAGCSSATRIPSVASESGGGFPLFRASGGYVAVPNLTNFKRRRHVATTIVHRSIYICIRTRLVC